MTPTLQISGFIHTQLKANGMLVHRTGTIMNETFSFDGINQCHCIMNGSWNGSWTLKHYIVWVEHLHLITGKCLIKCQVANCTSPSFINGFLMSHVKHLYSIKNLFAKSKNKRVGNITGSLPKNLLC